MINQLKTLCIKQIFRIFKRFLKQICIHNLCVIINARNLDHLRSEPKQTSSPNKR